MIDMGDSDNPLVAWYVKNLRPETLQTLRRWVAAARVGGISHPTARQYLWPVLVEAMRDPFVLTLARSHTEGLATTSVDIDAREMMVLLRTVRELGAAFGLSFSYADYSTRGG